MQSLATYLLQKESQTVFPLDNKGRPEVFPMSKLTLTKDVIDAFLGRTNFRVLQIRFIKRHAPDFFVAEHTHWTPLV
ncbi:hypothetical protein, partial [Vibrio breoganii]|uniref:hypothetical protein n=1 Tax=Vibrio breoganii TaxID=553239 RepID=UPI001A7E171C